MGDQPGPNPAESSNTPAGTEKRPLTASEKSLVDQLHSEKVKNEQLQDLLSKVPASLDRIADKMDSAVTTPKMSEEQVIEGQVEKEMQADIDFYAAEVKAERLTLDEANAKLDKLAAPIRKNIKLEREIQGLRNDLNSVKAEAKIPIVQSLFKESGIEPGSEMHKNVMADLADAGVDLTNPEVVRQLPVELIQKQIRLAKKANQAGAAPTAPKTPSQAEDSIPAHDTGYTPPSSNGDKPKGAPSFAALKNQLGYQ